MSGPTVLEPSALIDPVRPESGPAGMLTVDAGRGRPQPLATSAMATNATGQMRTGQRKRVHTSRAWQPIRGQRRALLLPDWVQVVNDW
jgi:hypothetical protein